MTAPVLAPPAILTDSHGLRWVFCGMTELGPAYRPQQAPLPMIALQPAPVELDWQTVTALTQPDLSHEIVPAHIWEEAYARRPNQTTARTSPHAPEEGEAK